MPESSGRSDLTDRGGGESVGQVATVDVIAELLQLMEGGFGAGRDGIFWAVLVIVQNFENAIAFAARCAGAIDVAAIGEQGRPRRVSSLGRATRVGTAVQGGVELLGNLALVTNLFEVVDGVSQGGRHISIVHAIVVMRLGDQVAAVTVISLTIGRAASRQNRESVTYLPNVVAIDGKGFSLRSTGTGIRSTMIMIMIIRAMSTERDSQKRHEGKVEVRAKNLHGRRALQRICCVSVAMAEVCELLVPGKA
jgi:hypothetical protein